MKLLLSTGSVSSLPAAQVFTVARAAGFDGLEYVVDNRHSAESPAELQALSEATHLPVLGVHAPYHRVDGWGDQAASLVHSVVLARSLNARSVTFHPPRRVIEHVEIARWIANTGDFQDQVGGGDVVVAVENMPRVKVWRGHRVPFATTPFRYQRPDELRGLLDSHNLALTLDTTHVAAAGEDLPRYFTRFKDRVALVHLSNFDRSRHLEHLPPDSGDLDLDRFLRMLLAAGYDGAITLEIMPRRLLAHPKGLEAALAETVTWVRRRLSAGDRAVADPSL